MKRSRDEKCQPSTKKQKTELDMELEFQDEITDEQFEQFEQFAVDLRTEAAQIVTKLSNNYLSDFIKCGKIVGALANIFDRDSQGLELVQQLNKRSKQLPGSLKRRYQDSKSHYTITNLRQWLQADIIAERSQTLTPDQQVVITMMNNIISTTDETFNKTIIAFLIKLIPTKAHELTRRFIDDGLADWNIYEPMYNETAAEAKTDTNVITLTHFQNYVQTYTRATDTDTDTYQYSDYVRFYDDSQTIEELNNYLCSVFIRIENGGNAFYYAKGFKDNVEVYTQLSNPPFKGEPKKLRQTGIKMQTFDKKGNVKTKDVFFDVQYQQCLQDNIAPTYEWTEFRPYLKDDESTNFNTFTGFRFDYEETSGDVDIILEFIRTTLAENDDNNFKYILNYLADMIQNPAKVPGVCLVFKSDKQGVGKNLFFEWVGKLMGKRYYLVSKDLDSIVKQFNLSRAGKILHILDEISNYGGAYKSNDRLKSEITQETLEIEPKGKESYSIAHCARYVMLTNHDWPVKIENSDRRFAMFNCSCHNAGNHDYFENLVGWMENEGNQQSFFNYLANYDLTGFHPRRSIPESKWKLSSKLQNQEAQPLLFLCKLVRDDNMNCMLESNKHQVTSGWLFTRYLDWRTSENMDTKVTKNKTSIILKKMGLQTVRFKDSGAVARGWMVSRPIINKLINNYLGCTDKTYNDIN